MNTLKELKSFDIQNSEVKLWTFKGTAPKLNGHWIETSDNLDKSLKIIVQDQLVSLTEELDYSQMAENNESSVLTLPLDETHADVLRDVMSDQTSRRKTKALTTLRNARFYAVRIANDNGYIFAVRKAESSWKTKEQISVLSVIYSDKVLDLAEDQSFKIHRDFDFFVKGDRVFVANKRNFESVLCYREEHMRDFADLTVNSSFVANFDSLDALKEYVGENRTHLRRMSAIRSKGFFSNQIFMANLRAKFADFGLHINFDVNGKIIPCAHTCKDIMTALLDHRLRSGFSGNTYDVQNTTIIN